VQYKFDMMNVPQRLIYHLTHEEAVPALALLQDSRSQRYVARVLGIYNSTIVRLAQTHQETGNAHRKPEQGRRRVTLLRDDRFLRLTGLRTRHSTASKGDVSQRCGNFAENYKNRLREDNIRARVPGRTSQLTRKYCVARLAFAREHVNWNIGDSQNVMFSDE
jgi:hypothetical protein